MHKHVGFKRFYALGIDSCAQACGFYAILWTESSSSVHKHVGFMRLMLNFVHEHVGFTRFGYFIGWLGRLFCSQACGF